ncbi:universal stress protein [Streptomyces sp. F-3]|uniref:universal stress protein n=1 Tax=Streptomyces sp. F-3 TaxID=1840095 RepID=UPI0007C21BAE|nr:universal stress protein [Streptomyces sp. F-3]GAT80251.1 universal stress protein [Streptomyces sp. F-3]
MQLPLVVGVDGSEPSLRAVDWAADEAVLRGVPLRVVHASLWEFPPSPRPARAEETPVEGAVPGKPQEQVRAEDVVEAAARRARVRHPGLPISRAALPEEPEAALVRESRNASVLVVGARGRSAVADLLLGSVSLFVAAHADCPVVVVRGGHDNQVRTPVHGRVVVGVGDESAEAVRFAAEEAERRGAVLEAVRAWRRPAYEGLSHPLITGEPAHVHEERAARALEAALRDVPSQVKLERRTVEGPARGVLLAAARHADLLVVGVRCRPGSLGLRLGRTAHRVLHHAACPVAVVPERERGEAVPEGARGTREPREERP